MTWTHWWQVRAGATDAAVLGVDFAVNRADASFRDMSARLPGWVSMWQVLLPEPPPSAPLATADPAWYVDQWLADVRPDLPHVRAVLGHCAGSALASALVDAAAELGHHRPRLVLIEPRTVSAATIGWEFARAAAGLLEAAPKSEVNLQVAVVTETANRTGADVVEIAELARTRYTALAATCGTHLGLSDAIVAELTGRFTTYLRYLVASSRVAVGPFDPRDAVVVSAGHPLAAESDQVVVVDCPTERMLADPVVAGLVADGLGHRQHD